MRRVLFCLLVSLSLLAAMACNVSNLDRSASSDAGDGRDTRDETLAPDSDTARDDAARDTATDATADADASTGDTAPSPEVGPDAEPDPDPDDGCDPGYSPDGTGECKADPVSEPATRSRHEVCSRWTGYSRQMSDLWQQEPVDQCDWGVLHPEARGDALRRLSLFRWLVGLDPVVSNPSYVEVTQACATTLAAEGAGLTHHIPSDFACYTQEASSGASSSNIALGVGEPASSVDLYVGDSGVPSLGHRRWCLNPSMGATGFGQRGRYSCMYSFDRGAPSSVQHVFYPSAGFFPRAALLGVWSAGSSAFDFGSSPTVAVTNVADGSSLQVDNVSTLPYGYALNTISWQVPDAQPEVAYEVTISNGTDTLSYQTTLVNCP